MFVRIRWFVAGVLAAFGGISYLATQVKRAREKLSPANMFAAGKHQAAAWIDSLAEKVAPEETWRPRR